MSFGGGFSTRSIEPRLRPSSPLTPTSGTAIRVELPLGAIRPEVRDLFRRGYPLHPETLAVLTEKLSSLSTFQRTRGMLRLLARTVHVLWRDRPADALAIHPHHIDPSFGRIREEITTRLGQGEYTPALKADVAAVPGG